MCNILNGMYTLEWSRHSMMKRFEVVGKQLATRNDFCIEEVQPQLINCDHGL